MNVATESIPDELRQLDQWVCWKSVLKPGAKKTTKMPFQPDGKPAEADNPATWHTYADCVAACERNKSFAGIGIELGSRDKSGSLVLAGCDQDNCIDAHTGEFHEKANEIIERLDSYAEISPGTLGVKILTFVQRGFAEGRKFPAPWGGKDGRIELYSSGRFFTITGKHLSGTPGVVEDRTEQMHELYDRLESERQAEQARKAALNPPKTYTHRDVSDIPMHQREARCWKYIEKCPDAISGQDGSGRTIHIACECFRFGLDDAAVWRVLERFNVLKTGGEPWTEGELRHKIDDARAKVNGSFGSRLREDRPAIARHSKPKPTAGVIKQPTDENEPTPDDEFRATELANAEEVHRQRGSSLLYGVDRGEYFIWCGTHWQRDIDGQVSRWVKEIARGTEARLQAGIDARTLSRHIAKMESSSGVSGVLKLLQTEAGVSAAAAAFDADDYALNASNGTLCLTTFALRPHRQRDRITHCLKTPYLADAKCPIWESVVSRSFAGKPELIGYLQRWAALFLTGCPNIHELLIAYGVGANGKSVIFDTLTALLEGYAGVAPESLLIANQHAQHPTEIADLLGKRLVIASETESGANLRLQLVKRLTGDATIKARFMRQDFFEFRRTHKLVLITNNRPRLTENTEAVWRRLRILPFNVVIPPAERDPLLLDKLRAEFPGILAWCVRGCRDWQRNGMKPPADVLIATEEYRDDADDLAEFIESCCIVGDAETFRVMRAELFTEYVAWSRNGGDRHTLDRNAFYEAVRRREGIVEDRWKSAGRAVRGFRGIGVMKQTRTTEFAPKHGEEV